MLGLSCGFSLAFLMIFHKGYSRRFMYLCLWLIVTSVHWKFGALGLKSPTNKPAAYPSSQPSIQSNGESTEQPTGLPSVLPSQQSTSLKPSEQPTCQTSAQPSSRPSTQPSSFPASKPSSVPSISPSVQPSNQPSHQPSSQPSADPSRQSTTQPSTLPSHQPSSQPSGSPSRQPQSVPSAQLSGKPSSRPSSVPSNQPSASPSSRPSSVPSIQPSRKPSSQPSSVPSHQPSASPSSQPSSVPSNQPSASPSSQPASVPSNQPSASPSSQPSSVPSSQPSGKPSSQPSGLPSVRPTLTSSAQPTTRFTIQPSVTPSSQSFGRPSCEPSSQSSSSQPTPGTSVVLSLPPSLRPTESPLHSVLPTRVPSTLPETLTGAEWATLVTRESSLSQLSIIGSQVWACGQDHNQTTTSCALLDVRTGDTTVMYQFQWAYIVSPVITTTTAGGSVVISGRFNQTDAVASECANCVMRDAQLFCDLTTLTNMRAMAVSYLPYPNRIVYFGTINARLSAVIIDASNFSVRSFVYTLFNMKSVVLSQVQSLPNFVGSFVAGTAVRSAGITVNSIITGMLRTDNGVLSMMSIVPVEGDITSNVDLVTSSALETIGPDLFVVGGLTLSDGAGKHAYLLRVNALYKTISYCVRYRAIDDVISEHRRALTSTSVLFSVARGTACVGRDLYLLVKTVRQNSTSATVLKVREVSGVVSKQMHLFAPVGNLVCSGITSSGLYLVIACILQYNSTTRQSVVISVDSELTFSALPNGIVRYNSTLFSSEVVSMGESVVSVTTTNTKIGTSNYQFNTADQAPTRRPSATPSSQPSSQPSGSPSAQPRSSPTSAPSVSPRPTSTPSTSGPTNTHKPSTAPTIRPTATPSVTHTLPPSTKPSTRPSISPSAAPSAIPSWQPTVKPSLRPTRTPTSSPTRAPSLAPSAVPVRVPSAPPTAAPTEGSSASSTDRSTVIWSAVGGALLLCVVGYAWYQYRKYTIEEEAKAKRKAEYFAYQALLVAALEKEREEMIRQIRLEDARKEKLRRMQRAKTVTAERNSVDSLTGASYGITAPIGNSQLASDVLTSPNEPPATVAALPSSSGGNSSRSSTSVSSSDSSSNYSISSLHTSEADFADYY